MPLRSRTSESVVRNSFSSIFKNASERELGILPSEKERLKTCIMSVPWFSGSAASAKMDSPCASTDFSSSACVQLWVLLRLSPLGSPPCSYPNYDLGSTRPCMDADGRPPPLERIPCLSPEGRCSHVRIEISRCVTPLIGQQGFQCFPCLSSSNCHNVFHM